jgi:hypothetical protein
MKPGACSNSRCWRSFWAASRCSASTRSGRLDADDQHAADAARAAVVANGAVAVGPVDVLAPAVAGDRHQVVLCQVAPSPGHHLLDLRPDDVPDLVPHLAGGPAERARMTLRADRLAIGVVVQAGAVVAPPDVHRVAGIEQQPYGGAQRLTATSRDPRARSDQSWARISAPISPPPLRNARVSSWPEPPLFRVPMSRVLNSQPPASRQTKVRGQPARRYAIRPQ